MAENLYGTFVVEMNNRLIATNFCDIVLFGIIYFIF